MSTLRLLTTIVYIIVCVLLVIVVLMQEGKNSGLGALSGSADTDWTRNKGRSAEGILVKITRVASVIFVVLSLLLCTTWID